MKNWPKSRWVQSGLALVGATFLASLGTWLVFRLSFAYFVWRYPHDGQDVLGSVFLALVVGPVLEIAWFTALFVLQRNWTVPRHSN
jgi:hypothetical protein